MSTIILVGALIGVVGIVALVAWIDPKGPPEGFYTDRRCRSCGATS